MEKKTKKQWHLMEDKYDLVQSSDKYTGLFNNKSFSVSITVFVNLETGQIRLYADKIVQKIGAEELLKQLND